MPGRYLLALAALYAFAPHARAQCSKGGDTPVPPLRLARLGGGVPSVWMSPRAVTNEAEPNDSAPTAMLVTLGDAVNGVIGAVGDVDYFAVDLAAGTQLEFNLDLQGSALYNPTQWLVDTDGHTPLMTHDWESAEHRIRYTISTTGRYFLRVGDYRGRGGATSTYVLSLDRYVPPPLGPGDPVAAVYSAATIPAFAGIAAASSGDVLAGWSLGVIRIGPNGDVTPDPAPYGGRLAIDAFGNLLILGCEYPNGVVWRISPTGERSRFFVGPGTPQAITVGPDGDVWVHDYDTGMLWRFDPMGDRKATIATDYYVNDLAFSPAGDLHYTSYEGLYKLVNNTPERVIATNPNEYFTSFVFDRDGYAYVVVSTYHEGGAADRIILMDPQFRIAQDPFAQVGDHFGLSTIYDLTFARDPAGGMTSRLLAAQSVSNSPTYSPAGAIVELNQAGVRAPGWRVGVDFLPVDLVAHRTSAVGVAYADMLRMQNAPGAVTWTIESGALPPGVTLESGSGVLAGVPTDTGAFTFSARGRSGARFGFAQFTISVAPAQLSVADVTNALLGGNRLSPALVEFLDRHGNNNGMLDAGDLRAYLRAQGQLPANSARIQP